MKAAGTGLALLVIGGISVLIFSDHESPSTAVATNAAESANDPGSHGSSASARAPETPLTGQVELTPRQAAASFDVEKPDWEAIEAGLKSEDGAARWLLVSRLCRVRDPRAVEVLIEALDDEELSVREEAGRGIEALVGFKVSLEALSDPYLRKGEIDRVESWWQERGTRSVEALRLEALKKRAKNK